MSIAERAMIVSGVVIAMGLVGLYILGKMRLHEENRVMRRAAHRADVVTAEDRLRDHPQRVTR